GEGVAGERHRASARPSPSQPCGLGPSLSRGAGEGLLCAMLTVGELSAGYGRIQVLNGVSFAVAAGEFVGVLGHNGMGKTTLLKTLIGIIRASAGRVTFDGADITAAPSHRRARLGIGYVPQG